MISSFFVPCSYSYWVVCVPWIKPQLYLPFVAVFYYNKYFQQFDDKLVFCKKRTHEVDLNAGFGNMIAGISVSHLTIVNILYKYFHLLSNFQNCSVDRTAEIKDALSNVNNTFSFVLLIFTMGNNYQRVRESAREVKEIAESLNSQLIIFPWMSLLLTQTVEIYSQVCIINKLVLANILGHKLLEIFDRMGL